jgi:DNA-binding transcriptional ArsR family regulator
VENPEKNDEFFDKIEVFSSEDDKLKFLGELLSNESSRQILLLLTNQEMSANELSEKTNLRLSLVIHHLKKMQQVGIVKIVKTEKNTKNHDMKYYSAKSGIMIFSQEASERAKKSKIFQLSVKKVFKFASIAISGLVSWFTAETILKNPFSETDPSHTGIVPFVDTGELSISVIVGLSFIIMGLVIERIHASLKNNSDIKLK